MAAGDIEQGQSPPHLADATPVHVEDQIAEGQELQLQHPEVEGVPVTFGPPAKIVRTHRPAHLDEDARKQASARRAELVAQGAEASSVEDCGVPGDVDEEQVDARMFEPRWKQTA